MIASHVGSILANTQACYQEQVGVANTVFQDTMAVGNSFATLFATVLRTVLRTRVGSSVRPALQYATSAVFQCAISAVLQCAIPAVLLYDH